MTWIVCAYLIVGFVVAYVKYSLIRRDDAEAFRNLDTNPIIPQRAKPHIVAISMVVVALIWPVALIGPIKRALRHQGEP